MIEDVTGPSIIKRGVREAPQAHEILFKLIVQILGDINMPYETDKDKCTVVCEALKLKLLEIGGIFEVNLVTKKFDNYIDLIIRKFVCHHTVLIVSVNKKFFLVDPTFGQFIGKAEILVHEITGEKKNGCLQELLKHRDSLGDNVFNFLVNLIASEQY